MTRTSFELHPDCCRVVAVDVSSNVSLASGEVRVRAFITGMMEAPGSAGFVRALQQCRATHGLPREAVVTIWGLRATHQCVRFAPDDETDLEADALYAAKEEIALLEADGSLASIALSIGAEPVTAAGQVREVSLTAASGTDIAHRLEPLVSAGFDVVRVLTPAMALTSVARSRNDALPGVASMYVALAPRATAIAIVRDGFLLVARELPLGHAGSDPADARSFDAHLASELRKSQLLFRQMFRSTIDAIVMCGDAPNPRSLAGSIGSAIGIPVQTLDSLSGIDAIAVPEPADEFRADVAALRLAIAAGAEQAPYANLLQTAPPLRVRSRHLARYAAVAAAALLVGFAIWYAFVRTPTSRVPARESSSEPPARPAGGTTKAPIAVVPPAASEPSIASPAPGETPPQVAVAEIPPAVPAAVDREMVLNSILYSAERRLAILDGRIAGPGDRVGDVRIVAIEPRAVIVESADGRRRRIELGAEASPRALR